jgi:hypothetical protein
MDIFGTLPKPVMFHRRLQQFLYQMNQKGKYCRKSLLDSNLRKTEKLARFCR